MTKKKKKKEKNPERREGDPMSKDFHALVTHCYVFTRFVLLSD